MRKPQDKRVTLSCFDRLVLPALLKCYASTTRPPGGYLETVFLPGMIPALNECFSAR
jgi:hypothetical protein